LLNQELDSKLKTLISEYAQIRAENESVKLKARQMLVDKDKEIKKIKGMAPEADFEDEEQKENDKLLDGGSGANSDQEKEKP
jgi:hypothetical protein